MTTAVTTQGIAHAAQQIPLPRTSPDSGCDGDLGNRSSATSHLAMQATAIVSSNGVNADHEPRDASFRAKSGNAATREKSSSAWQEQLWRRWPREDDWPPRLDVYEAAAYLRISPDTIRRALVQARDGRARLAHQRVGAIYRIRRSDLDEFGKVNAR